MNERKKTTSPSKWKAVVVQDHFALSALPEHFIAF